jgi:glycosyltransferase involved in cell wall biosynthesis
MALKHTLPHPTETPPPRGGRSPGALIVHHLGPDPTTVGGMATVIRVLTESNVGGDVVDCHPTWTPRSPLATARLFATSTQALLRMPTTDVVHVHLSERGSFLREGALLALAHRRGLVTVATMHGASFVPFTRRYPRLVAAVLRRADLITCLDRPTLNLVRRSAPDVRSEILPNPAVIEEGVPPVDRTAELVVFAGETGLRKGADVLARAWPEVARRRPDARCLMVGPATEFVPPRAERMEVRAAVDPAEMRRILREARAIALPARAEGMPMILTEAMSLGRPFVSTPVGGIPELAEAGGILVPVGDEAALADRLTDLLADANLARTIGERGRRFCMATRSIEVIDARLRELYAAAGDARRDQ